MTKTSIFNNLTLLSLICFGISGSLSHIFNLGLVLFLAWNYLNSKNEFLIEPSAKKLFFVLCSVFFIFMIRGLFHTDTLASLESLSPMLPILFIGLMILFTNKDDFGFSAQRIENYAKIAVITTFLIYIVFSTSSAFHGITLYYHGRLEIFSGNPIPFSTAVFGITLFCFTNWKHSGIVSKSITIVCLLIGFWLAGIASGTRGTLLAIIVAIPILFWLATQSIYRFLLITFIAVSILSILHLNGVSILGVKYLGRLEDGFDTLLAKGSSDYSIKIRMEMWSASISTIKDNVFWGHDISNRFSALSTKLPTAFENKFSHPHNDIFASFIGAGFIGGILSILSLLSPLLAALLSKDNSKEKLFLGFLVVLGIMTTANLNTVFFNDITAAWLAFSTFLIWNLNHSKEFDQDGIV